MPMVLMYSPVNFTGVISNTPTGNTYAAAPDQPVSVDQQDELFLLGRGFIAAAPPVPGSSGEGITDAPADGNTYGRSNNAWSTTLPLANGTVPAFGIAAPGINFPGMGAPANANYQFAWQGNRIWPYVNGIAQGAIAYVGDIPAPVPGPIGPTGPAGPTGPQGPPTAASTVPPNMDGVATPGTSPAYSPGDHVHPTDTSRYAATNPSGFQTAAQVTASLGPYALTASVPLGSSTLPVMDGTATIGVGTTWARADHVHASDTSRQSIMGVTNASNAIAGQIGEYLSGQLLSTAAIALTNNVDAVLYTLPLTAGDWDVWGSVGYTISGNNATVLKAWINPTGTVAPSVDQMGGYSVMPVTNNITQMITPITPLRVNVSTATNVALGATVTNAGGTISGFGKIMARRRR